MKDLIARIAALAEELDSVVVPLLKEEADDDTCRQCFDLVTIAHHMRNGVARLRFPSDIGAIKCNPTQ